MNENKNKCPIRVMSYSKSDDLPMCPVGTCSHILLPEEKQCPCHQVKEEPMKASSTHDIKCGKCYQIVHEVVYVNNDWICMECYPPNTCKTCGKKTRAIDGHYDCTPPISQREEKNKLTDISEEDLKDLEKNGAKITRIPLSTDWSEEFELRWKNWREDPDFWKKDIIDSISSHTQKVRQEERELLRHKIESYNRFTCGACENKVSSLSHTQFCQFRNDILSALSQEE